MHTCSDVLLLLLLQSTCLEEAARIEEFFDTARGRVEWLASRQEVAERRFANHGVPLERTIFKTTRHLSLHLAVIYMSRYACQVCAAVHDSLTGASAGDVCLLPLLTYA